MASRGSATPTIRMPPTAMLRVLSGGMAAKKAKAVAPDDFAKLVADARSATAKVACARCAGRTNEDVDRACLVLTAAFDFLAGDEVAAPHALDHVRRMHSALIATTREALEHEVGVAARNQRTCAESNRVPLARVFLQRIDPHIRALGSTTKGVKPEAVIALLARWRAKRKAGTHQLSTAGVLIELQGLVGVPREQAKSRLRMRRQGVNR